MNRKQIKMLMTIIDISAIAAFILFAWKFLNPIASLLESMLEVIKTVPIKEANPEYKLILIFVSIFAMLWFLSIFLRFIVLVAEQLKMICEREMKNMKPEQKFAKKK